ncbi:MAG: DUF4340 domain-containing protein [Chlorobi bacterium]|nr:DUF4340 domain-containing protein [Chlorobiota bacterium]
MSSDNTLKKYGIIFGVLAVIVLIMFFFDAGKKESTFKTDLTDIDTASVNQILIYPKGHNHKEIRLFKNEDGVWRVALEKKSVTVPPQKIKAVFSQLTDIKPIRLASRSESKWAAFQVDTSGTRVKALDGKDVALDIVIGKFSYKQQTRSMTSFVRLADEKEVYEVNGFLSTSFNRDANSFRNNRLINDDYKNWTRISFDYPADSSFQMVKVGNKWKAGDVELDSAKVANYIRPLSRLSSSAFVDELPEGLSADKFTRRVRIDSGGKREILLQSFEDGKNVIISSSENTESYFNGKSAKLQDKIFKGLNSFLRDE